MKLFFYCLREFDELTYARKCAEKYGIDFDYTDQYPSVENAALAKGCEAVSFTPCRMDAPIIDALHGQGVKYLLCHSIGFDHVDRAYAAKLGMRVANVGYPPDGVADYALMLILMSLRRMAHVLKRSELQDYSLKGKIGRDLRSCTVGVIGTGNIGRAVIERLAGFGCEILAYDVYENDAVKAHATYVPLSELFSRSDVITLHAPHNAGTHHILNAEAFDQMQNGTIIVNTARGALIDTPALISALEWGRIGAAALDVLENENGLYYYNRVGDVISNSEMALLRSMPNVILSPHTAFYTETNVEHMVEGNFRSFALMAGGQPDPHELH